MASSHQQEKAPSAIPKKLHFIWLGSPLPEKYFNSISKLADAAIRGGFELNLWVDNAENYHRTALRLDREIPNVRLRDVNELKKVMHEDKFYKEENRLKYYESYLAREHVGFKNLAAASDLLRYEILRQKGGYYIDTDTQFLLEKDSKLVTESPPHGFLLAGGVLFGGGTGPGYHFHGFVGGNDLIGAVPHCLFMEETIKYVLEKYKEFDTKYHSYVGSKTKDDFLPATTNVKQLTIMDKKRYPAKPSGRDSRPDRMELTIESSGPASIFRTAEEYMKKNTEQTWEDHSSILFKYDFRNDNLFNIAGIEV